MGGFFEGHIMFWYKIFIGGIFLNYSDSRVDELKYRKLGTEEANRKGHGTHSFRLHTDMHMYIRVFQINNFVFQRCLNFANLKVQVMTYLY